MKQRRRNKQNTCIHEQKKPEKRTKQERKLHGKQIKNCWCQVSRFLHSPKANVCKTIRHDRFTAHPSQYLIIKPTRCTNFSNLFWNETVHVSDSSSVHHQVFFTVHTAMIYVIQVCWQLARTYTIAMCTVKNSWWWTEKLSETAD